MARAPRKPAKKKPVKERSRPRERNRSSGRTKLVESKTEAALRRRGFELAGLCLFVLGLAIFALLWTYTPEDPSIFSATDAPPRNALGLVGASLADPLYRALGWAAYGLPVALIVWGTRLILHKGDERVISRMILLPIAIAIAAVFAAAHVPFSGWPHSYGLGGVLGDSVLAALLGIIPLPLGGALLVATIVLAIAFVALALVSLGVNWPEFRAILRFMRHGALVGFHGIVAGTAIASRQTVAGARQARSMQRDARERARHAREEKAAVANAAFSERLEEESEISLPSSDPADDDRVMARISAAVRARTSSGSPAPEGDTVPEVERTLPRLGGVSRESDGVSPPAPALRIRRDEPQVRPAEDAAAYDAGEVYEPYEEDLPATAPPPPPQRPEPVVKHPERRPAAKSNRARAEEQPSLALEEKSTEAYDMPPLSLLQNPVEIQRAHLSDEALEANARMLETVLDDYGIKGEIVAVRPGPVVTLYELEPAAGLKASRVIGLADDIARSMSALAARVSTIPGRSVIGIELPNEFREKVILREILSVKSYGDSSHTLPLALGKDIGGEPVVANLARMPHLLIAGTTGSGKSVAINTMILSLLYKLRPDECRLIMIDPKMLELSVYDGIPHLLSPVVTDPKKAVVALKWTVAEMEERYRKMSKMGVRNIDGYNGRVEEALSKGEAFTRTVQTGFDDATGEPIFETEEYAPEKMPFIVVIVDEMADLMMVAGKEIEACIQRLAQMARASGIHLIMATQRPSVDVITGTIKANFPTRISFQVTSKIDSRTILGEMGAEQLLGMGDMLYMAGGGKITRVHGPFVSDEEVEEIVNHLKLQGVPEYVSGVVEGPEAEKESAIDQVLGLGGNTNGEDALYDQAVAIVARDRKCSTSYIQRKLAIGYNKAARLVEQMEDEGVVSSANSVGKREILVPEA
ncbi:DNA translocase FtsK [Algicella marina]|uniref:DNA translocase FtsK n=1 Tax=Algicella marina TaxID=2683284 RepID=A0A6P1T300_9RHOB|nr:DNA translocase FtsK [Algicella marina]QHQ36387.1 DNA translocase FtsK [Algicella marina]